MQKPETFLLQDNLILYCRSGENPPPNTKPENMHHYRRLVYNVVRDTIKKANPLFVELFGKENFEKSVHHFYSIHKCQTPQVWKLPFEFYQFYCKNKLPFEQTCHFVNELLLFEWTELETFMMEDEDVIPYQIEGNLENDFLVSNPEIRILPLTYPIHKKKIKEIIEEDKGQYFVIFVRNPESKKVFYYNISYPLAEMLVKINDEPTKYSDLLSVISKYENTDEKIKERTQKLFDFAIKNKMILGYTQKTTLN